MLLPFWEMIFFLKTITEEGDKTEVYLKWDIFQKAEYLDDVKIFVNHL